MTKKYKGFTLIELLVVIAIIGILAAIVLVSLSGARNKAKNARIQGDISQVRSIAELLYNESSPMNYNNLCDDSHTLNEGAPSPYGAQLNAIETDIKTQNGGIPPKCYASGDDYCVSANLVGGGVVCISSAGQVGDDVCSAANTTCD